MSKKAPVNDAFINHAPVAVNDANATTEDAPVTGNVLSNDYDPDPLDSFHVSFVEGAKVNGSGTTTITLASGGSVTIAADGTYTYDSNGVFTYLMTGEQLQDSFTYTITDSHGATSTATVTIAVDGIGLHPYDPLPPELPGLGLGHGYWKTHDGSPNPNDWNIKLGASFEQYFGVDLNWSKNGNKPGKIKDVSFHDAIDLKGGGNNALAREAVTAILNALDEKNGTQYDFAYSVDKIISMVHDAYASHDAALIEHTKDLLLASHE
ncbi:MAG: cadherin-like domain-containing protein [Alphaproteobacteria bacterium]|nr:cadherin-like domain-containing protein [Alphaproteobacteria bacterium]